MDPNTERKPKLDKNNFQHFEPELIATIWGDKPACFVDIKSVNLDEVKLLERYGFECVKTNFADRENTELAPNQWTIAKKLQTEQVFHKSQLEHFIQIFPQLAQRLELMYEKVKSMNLANSLATLCAYPRVDSDFPDVKRFNLERPEVAIIQGILLGYPQKDVDYYIKTRYLGEPRVETDLTSSDLYTYVRDPNN